MRPTTFLASFTAFSAACAAQLVLPPAATTYPPSLGKPATDSALFTEVAPGARAQLVYSAHDVGGAAHAWSSMAVRRSAIASAACPEYSCNARIVFSIEPYEPSSVTPTFQANVGNSTWQPTIVFEGPVSLPTRATPALPPAEFESLILFTQPFIFVANKGHSLVVDVTQGYSSSATPWLLDATAFEAGTTAVNDVGSLASCRFGNGGYLSGSRVPAGGIPAIGGALASYAVDAANGDIPSGAAAFGVLGAQGVGTTWSGLALPYDLAAFGSAGCKLGVSMDLVLPFGTLTASAPTYTWPSLPVPAITALAGARIYAQTLFVEAPAHVITAPSDSFTIGAGGPDAAIVSFKGYDPLAPSLTGTVELGKAITLKLY